MLDFDYITTLPKLEKELPETIDYLIEKDLSISPIENPSKKVKQLDANNWMTYKLYLVNNPNLEQEDIDYHNGIIDMLIKKEDDLLKEALFSLDNWMTCKLYLVNNPDYKQEEIDKTNNIIDRLIEKEEDLLEEVLYICPQQNI